MAHALRKRNQNRSNMGADYQHACFRTYQTLHHTHFVSIVLAIESKHSTDTEVIRGHQK